MATLAQPLDRDRLRRQLANSLPQKTADPASSGLGGTAHPLPGMNELRVLLVGDDPGAVGQTRQLLSEIPAEMLRVSCDECCPATFDPLRIDHSDVILLDLADTAGGMESVRHALGVARDVPVVVLVSPDGHGLAAQAVKEGAQDYLVKDQYDGRLLLRSLGYAVRLRQMELALGHMSFDPLTGLYNRHSFLLLTEHHLKLAKRTDGAVLMTADLVHLELLNRRFGFREGNRALRDAAELLRQTFRESDVLARVGGDEFAALAVGAGPETANRLADRFEHNLSRFNSVGRRRYALAMTLGFSCLPAEEQPSVGALLARATPVDRPRA